MISGTVRIPPRPPSLHTMSTSLHLWYTWIFIRLTSSLSLKLWILQDANAYEHFKLSSVIYIFSEQFHIFLVLLEEQTQDADLQVGREVPAFERKRVQRGGSRALSKNFFWVKLYSAWTLCLAHLRRFSEECQEARNAWANSKNVEGSNILNKEEICLELEKWGLVSMSPKLY